MHACVVSHALGDSVKNLSLTQGGAFVQERAAESLALSAASFVKKSIAMTRYKYLIRKRQLVTYERTILVQKFAGITEFELTF